MLDVLIAVDQPSMQKGLQAMFQERDDVRLWYNSAIHSSPGGLPKPWATM